MCWFGNLSKDWATRREGGEGGEKGEEEKGGPIAKVYQSTAIMMLRAARMLTRPVSVAVTMATTTSAAVPTSNLVAAAAARRALLPAVSRRGFQASATSSSDKLFVVSFFCLV